MSRLGLYLRLGRVSNLPTVWSNTLCGASLSGGRASPGTLAAAGLAFSLAYVGGMFLNDAFDREIDARERPERPIPSGQIAAAEVYAVGFGLLGAAVVLLTALGGWRGALAGLGLSGAIVLYDAWHKGNALSPLLMAACRVLVYVGAAVAVEGRVAGGVFATAVVALLTYLMGLTYVAKQENLAEVKNMWPLALLATPLLLTAESASHEALTALLFVTLLAWITRSGRRT